jgi:hypothetical protein
MAESKTLIEVDPLDFTKLAGYVSLGVAGIGGVLLIAQGVAEASAEQGWPTEVQVGLLVLVGLALIAGAVAGAADVLARAYATGHVSADGDDRFPAVLVAGDAIAQAYRPAGEAKGKAAPEMAAERLAAAYEKAREADDEHRSLIPAPRGMRADVAKVGTDLEVLALRWHAEKKALQYLVGPSDKKPDWADDPAVTIRP